MTTPVGDVRAAITNATDPVVVVQRAGKLNIRSPQTHTMRSDTWEIRFPANPRAKTAVECVIPDVEFPNGGSVYCRDEIHGIMCDVDDIFVGADPIECGHFIIRQFVRFNFEAPPGMREPDC